MRVVLILFFLSFFYSCETEKVEFAIVIHGGAGTILKENMDKLIVQTQIGQLTIDKGNVETIQEIAPSNAKVEFSGDAQEKIYDSGKSFSGTVTNNGLQRADFVRIIYNLWGSETDLIASDSSFIEGL